MPYIFHGSNLVICIFCSVRVLCGIVLTWIADRSINYFAHGKPYALPCVSEEIWNTRLGVFDGPTPGKYRDLLQYNHIYHNTITIGLGMNLLTNIPNIISTSKSIITRSNFSSRSLMVDISRVTLIPLKPCLGLIIWLERNTKRDWSLLMWLRWSAYDILHFALWIMMILTDL